MLFHYSKSLNIYSACKEATLYKAYDPTNLKCHFYFMIDQTMSFCNLDPANKNQINDLNLVQSSSLFDKRLLLD